MIIVPIYQSSQDLRKIVCPQERGCSSHADLFQIVSVAVLMQMLRAPPMPRNQSRYSTHCHRLSAPKYCPTTVHPTNSSPLLFPAAALSHSPSRPHSSSPPARPTVAPMSPEEKPRPVTSHPPLPQQSAALLASSFSSPTSAPPAASTQTVSRPSRTECDTSLRASARNRARKNGSRDSCRNSTSSLWGTLCRGRTAGGRRGC